HGTIKLCAVSADNPAQLVHELRGHGGPVVFAAFSPDGKTAVTRGQGDRAARLWDTTTGAFLGAPPWNRGDVWRVVFSPDGKTGPGLPQSGPMEVVGHGYWQAPRRPPPAGSRHPRRGVQP